MTPVLPRVSARQNLGCSRGFCRIFRLENEFRVSVGVWKREREKEATPCGSRWPGSEAGVQPAPLGDLTPFTAPCARPPSTQDFRRVTNRVTPRNQTQIYAEFYNKSNAGVAAMETMEEREEGHGTAQRTQRERTRWASQGRRASQNPSRFHRQTDRVSV